MKREFCKKIKRLYEECIHCIKEGVHRIYLSPPLITISLFIIGLYLFNWNARILLEKLFEVGWAFVFLLVSLVFIFPLSQMFKILLQKLRTSQRSTIYLPNILGLEIENGLIEGKQPSRDTFIYTGKLLMEEERYLEAFFQYTHAFTMNRDSINIAYGRLEALCYHYFKNNNPKIKKEVLEGVFEEVYTVACKKSQCDIKASKRRDMQNCILKIEEGRKENKEKELSEIIRQNICPEIKLSDSPMF